MRFLVVLAISTALVAAQETAPRKNTDGEVQSTDPASKQLKIKNDAGVTYTVTTDDKTNFLRVGADLDIKKAAKIALPEISTGDRVRARGIVSDDTKTIAATTVVVMTKADVAQKQQKDRDEWLKRGVAGTVTAIDPKTHEITIRIDTIPPKTATVEATDKATFRRYAPDSVKFSDAKPSTFAELSVGDRLRALGDKNEDGTRYKAEDVVSGSFRTLAAQVISVDAAANTIKVTDLSSKDKQPLTIHVNADTSMRRIPEMMARMLSARLTGKAGLQADLPVVIQPDPPVALRAASGGNPYRQGGGPGGAGGAPGRGEGAGGPGGPGGGMAIRRRPRRRPSPDARTASSN